MDPADLQAVFRGRRVLITGDTGFKGSWLALWLHDMGAKVTGFALPPEGERPLFQALGLSDLIDHVDGDIRDAAAVDAVFARADPEFVFHLAAQPLVRRSYVEPKLTMDTNVGGSVNVLEAARRARSLRAIVVVTSDKCYRNNEWTWGYREIDELGGRDPYSASKAAAELVVASYRDSFFADAAAPGLASVRAGNVIGGGDRAVDRLVPDTLRALAADAPVHLRNPQATRPWQHVLDPLHGYLVLAARLAQKPREFASAWNFGPAEESCCTTDEIAQRIVAAWGKGRIEHAPVNGAPHEAGILRLNCEKARTYLGWRPHWGLDETIVETVRWYREVEAGKAALDITRAQIAAFQEVRG